MAALGTSSPYYHHTNTTTTTTTTNMMTPQGPSRLAAMQARVREKLMHEKESRLLQMAARQEAEREGTIQRVTRSSTSNLSSSLSSISSLNSSMGGQGRVRKLFEERRTNGYGNSPVGRDKSYPLEPVRGTGGRPPPKPSKGVPRQRGVSVDRGRSTYDQEAMRRSRSHAGLQNNNANHANNNYEPRSPARALRPPQGKSLSHHKSTSSLLDANQNYNGRASSSSSGVYSRGASREPSPAPSPSPYNQNRFGFRGPPSRGPSPAPSPRRTSNNQDRTDGPRSQARQPQVAPPRQQQPRPPPRQRPQQKPSPPAYDDQDDSAFLSPNSQSKAKSPGGKITRVRSVTSPSPNRPNKPPRNPPSNAAPPKPIPPKIREQKPIPPPTSKDAMPPRSSKPPPGMASCKVCHRNFNSDRLEKHETICAKTAAKAKKRKLFDPIKMRTKGTEAEKFVAKGRHLKEAPKPKKKDWRKQHEDFIATIRAAKTGGVAPPSDNSDYVTCPHCGRKFNDAAAERHIPKCSSIKSNKPGGGRRR